MRRLLKVTLQSLGKAELPFHIRSVSRHILIGFTEVDKVDTSCFSVDFCSLLKVIYFRNLKHCCRTVLSDGRVVNRREMFPSLVEIPRWVRLCMQLLPSCIFAAIVLCPSRSAPFLVKSSLAFQCSLVIPVWEFM